MGHVLDLIRGVALVAIWVGLTVGLIRDTMPSVTWEWKLVRGAAFVSGATIICGWVLQALTR